MQSTYLENKHVDTIMYEFPCRDLGRKGPMKSSAKTSKGALAMSIGLISGRTAVCSFLDLAQVKHALQYSLISLAIVGQ